jgi:hypothetical protein
MLLGSNIEEHQNMRANTKSLAELNVVSDKSHTQSALDFPSAPANTNKNSDGHKFGRRSFMRGLALGAATFVPLGAALANPIFKRPVLGHISPGDASILRFLAAAEILETDLWQQ